MPQETKDDPNENSQDQPQKASDGVLTYGILARFFASEIPSSSLHREPEGRSAVQLGE